MFIRVLGKVGFGVDPASVTPVTERVTAMVLAHLASAGGRALAPEALVDAVWDRPTRTARNAVQVAMTKLRRSLGPDCVVADRAGYALRTDLLRVDWLEASDGDRSARDLCHQGAYRQALLVADRALALFEDVPFAGLNSETTTTLRDQANRTLDALTVLRARCLLASGRAEEAVDPLRHQLTAHEFDEPVAALLIEALARSGRTADAVTVFHDLRRRLGDELGVGPSEVTVGVFDKVLTDSLPPIAAQPDFVGTLSEPTAPTFGRNSDISHISALVANGHRLITVVGAGGLGKSTVAVVAARSVAADRGRPSVMVDLTLCARPEDVVTVATGALDPGDVGLAAALSGVAPVVILDNAEHVIGATAEIAGRLLAISGVDVLVTSRRPLGLKDERLFELEPLVGVGQGTPALALLLDRAGISVEQAAAHLEEFEQVAARADGVPLMLELYAAALRWRSPADLLADLDDPVTVMDVPDARDFPARHRSVAAVVDWSLSQLKPEVAAALAALTVIRGAFGERAAGAVIQPVVDLPVTEVLRAALDVSLLQRVRQPGKVRFRMLEPVRQGIRASTVGANYDLVRDAHARYFLGEVQSADDLSAHHPNAFRGIADGDQGNVLPALSWLWKRDEAAAMKRLPSVINYWSPKIVDDDTYFRWLDTALESEHAAELDRARIAIARFEAIVFFRNERPAEVAALTAVIARSAAQLEGRWKYRLYSAESGWARARGDLRDAIALLASSDPTGARDRVLRDARIAECHWYAGDLQRALAALDATDVELTRLRDYGLRRAVLSTRMFVALQQSDITGAQTYLGHLERLVTAEEGEADLPYLLSHVAWVDIECGRFAEAVGSAGELLTAREWLRVPVHLLELAMLTAFALLGVGAKHLADPAAALARRLDSRHPGILNPYARRRLQNLPSTAGVLDRPGYFDDHDDAVTLLQRLIADGRGDDWPRRSTK